MQRRLWLIGALIIIYGSPLFAQGSKNTTPIGRWTNGPFYATFAVDHLVYIGNDRAMQILDISNPASPVFLGQMITPSLVTAIFVSSGYAYVADGDAGLRIIDVSDPSKPVEVGFYDTPGRADHVYVSGGYAYVADADSGLRIIDVSDPAKPVEAGFYYTSREVIFFVGIYINGSYTYVADWMAGLRIIDVSDPTAPVEVGFYDTNGYARSVYVSGG